MTDIAKFIKKALGEYGPILDDTSVVELSANQNGCVFVEHTGSDPKYIGDLDSHARDRILRFCASVSGTVVTDEAPIVSVRMPETGFRFEGVRPPAAEAPLFSIRFHGATVFTMSDYVSQGVVDKDQSTYLMKALEERKNIVVAGGTGTGKTTFLNMLIGELGSFDGPERLLIIEDTPEIRTVNRNAVFLRTTSTVNMTRLLASTLRLRPDRIIVGEVRDGAALAMVKAWNTGHPGGLTSVHANSALAALSRIDLLVREASSMPLPEVIGHGVDIVVHIEAKRGARKITEIIEVKGYEYDKFVYTSR